MAIEPTNVAKVPQTELQSHNTVKAQNFLEQATVSVFSQAETIEQKITTGGTLFSFDLSALKAASADLAKKFDECTDKLSEKFKEFYTKCMNKTHEVLTKATEAIENGQSGENANVEEKAPVELNEF